MSLIKQFITNGTDNSGDYGTVTFDKQEFEDFWIDTQKSLIKDFIEYCSYHEMMYGCARELGDIDYLAKEYLKESKQFTSK